MRAHPASVNCSLGRFGFRTGGDARAYIVKGVYIPTSLP